MLYNCIMPLSAYKSITFLKSGRFAHGTEAMRHRCRFCASMRAGRTLPGHLFERIIRAAAENVKRLPQKMVFVLLIAVFSKINKNNSGFLLTSTKQLC